MNLLKYKNFESIQQAEKIIISNNIDRKRSNLLITEFQKLGLANYLGYCFQIIANDGFIYQPLDFKSYLIPGFQFWCTMQESMFERYLKLNMLILFNKIDKSKSYITYWSDNKIKIFNYKNNSDVIENIPEELRSIIEKYYL